MFGKDGKKKELIKNLSSIYDQIQREHQISPGDFPDIKKMQENLVHHDFSKFNPLKPKLLETVDKMLAEDISRLMQILPLEETSSNAPEPIIKGENKKSVKVKINKKLIGLIVKIKKSKKVANATANVVADAANVDVDAGCGNASGDGLQCQED